MSATTFAAVVARCMPELREAYQAQVAALAAELKTWDVSAIDPDCDELDEEASRFEHFCREHACSTLEEARMVNALAEHWQEADMGDWTDPRLGAALAIALDAAHLAGVRWFIDIWTNPSDERSAA